MRALSAALLIATVTGCSGSLGLQSWQDPPGVGAGRGPAAVDRDGTPGGAGAIPACKGRDGDVGCDDGG